MVGANAQSINKEKSIIEFKIGNMGLGSVEGTIQGMKGEINFNPKDLSNSSFDVVIDPASIDTDNEKRDTHLKDEDFFFVKKYLTIRFKSTKIIKKENGYVAIGKLTMHGVTKEINLPFNVATNGSSHTFLGEIEINRDDYNLGTEEFSGGFMVGKTADVKIKCIYE